MLKSEFTPEAKEEIRRMLDISGSESSGVTSYNDLTDKPSINSIELNGSKSLSDFGAASVEEVNAVREDVDSIDERMTTAEQNISAVSSKATTNESDISSLKTRMTTNENDIDVLEARFDNAVSAVSTDTELTDIRVGADGVIYTTAGDAVRGQVGDLKSALGDLIAPEIIPDQVGYLKTNVDTVDINNPIKPSSGGWRYIVVSCQAGDTFTVYGKYLGTAADLYTFTDSSYNVLERSEDSNIAKTYFPVAPENAAFVIFQKKTSVPNQFWKGISVINKIEQINGEVEEIKDDVDEMSFLIQQHFSQNLDGWEKKGITPATGAISSNPKRLLTVIPCTALSCYVDTGYSFLVYGWDGETYLGWYDGSAWTKDAMVSRTDALDISEFSSYKLYAVLIHGTSTGSAVNIDISEGVHFYTKNKTDSLLKTKNAPADSYAVGEALSKSEEAVRSDVKTFTGNEILIPSTSGYIRTDGTTVDISSPVAHSTIVYGVFSCEAGEAFTVKGTDPGSVAAYCTFIDSSYNILSREKGHADLTIINAPENSAYVLLQGTSSPNYMFIRGKCVAIELAEIGDILDNVDTLGGGYKSELYYTSDDSQDVVTNYDALIAMYDALVTEYPNYITKNALTHGSFTNYEYVFSMGDRNAGNGQRAKDATVEKPLVLIMAGTHGHERCSIMGLYLFAKALCESPELSALRSGLVIKMIPVVCPSGYNNNSRVNANRVNINRNFDANWRLTPDDGMNYSGAAPADQDETQVVQAWMNANADAAIEIDWHNSAYTNEVCYFATCIGTGFAVDAKKGYLYGLDRIVGHWINDRGIADSNTIYGYTGVDSANGTSYAYAKSINLNGCLYETSWNVGSYGKDTPETIGVNAEAFCATMRGIMSKYIDNL